MERSLLGTLKCIQKGAMSPVPEHSVTVRHMGIRQSVSGVLLHCQAEVAQGLFEALPRPLAHKMPAF
jgi:hypothetical protein